MKKLSVKEMKSINGGTITASFLTAMARSMSIFLEVGRTLGSSVRRIFAGSYCSL